jgi:hypothetical protein
VVEIYLDHPNFLCPPTKITRSADSSGSLGWAPRVPQMLCASFMQSGLQHIGTDHDPHSYLSQLDLAAVCLKNFPLITYTSTVNKSALCSGPIAVPTFPCCSQRSIECQPSGRKLVLTRESAFARDIGPARILSSLVAVESQEHC